MTHVLRSSRYVVRYAAMLTGVKGGGFGVHTAVSSSGLFQDISTWSRYRS
ncbi:Uncharacterized protein ANAPHAGO_00246 [Anaplasma phagocytophilum]|uniref:Uncharacterized protein n=1 Tax=Anaplasma phagocytophilum TaxID=948 RepID=A0A098EDX5_ANAPH|nr:Uncharacterized protein ANAPHAGO_00246 [Anaplasma phagocytophilum]